MYILGLSCFYHDAAACLLKDGVVVAAGSEVRVSPKEYLCYVKAQGKNLNNKFTDGKVGAGFTSTRMEVVTLQ